MGPAQDEPPPPEQKSGPELRGALWALDSVEVLCEPIEIIFYSQINLNIVISPESLPQSPWTANDWHARRTQRRQSLSRMEGGGLNMDPPR